MVVTPARRCGRGATRDGLRLDAAGVDVRVDEAGQDISARVVANDRGGRLFASFEDGGICRRPPRSCRSRRHARVVGGRRLRPSRTVQSWSSSSRSFLAGAIDARKGASKIVDGGHEQLLRLVAADLGDGVADQPEIVGGAAARFLIGVGKVRGVGFEQQPDPRAPCERCRTSRRGRRT